MAIFVIQSDLAYGMYRLTQGLTRRPTLSFARYKPMLKRLTVASGGLASLGGASYGLQMYNQKERKDCEGQIRKESEEWFLNRLSEADSFTWWDFIQSNVIGKRSDKIVSLPHDVVEEARMICDQLIPDMPVIGFCKYIRVRLHG